MCVHEHLYERSELAHFPRTIDIKMIAILINFYITLVINVQLRKQRYGFNKIPKLENTARCDLFKLTVYIAIKVERISTLAQTGIR